MPTEIRRIDVRSAFQMSLALGAVNGVLVSLPVVGHWLQTAEWVTGVRMGPGTFAFGVLLSVLVAAITTAVVVVVFVVVYNRVARSFGGLEVSLSR